jgi:hypothetical protein
MVSPTLPCQFLIKVPDAKSVYYSRGLHPSQLRVGSSSRTRQQSIFQSWGFDFDSAVKLCLDRLRIYS